MHFFEEAKQIWQMYVPKRGQAETVQGELLRAVEKLRDEAIRNGNCNWDDGFDLLISYLEQHLTDVSVYSQDTVAQTRSTLGRLRDYDFPCLEDDLYDELGDRVVEHFRFYGIQPHVQNSQLHR
ncbi:hypothetical protein ACYX7E_04120 [Luteimonas sp. RIT-PG2_3]